MMELDPAGIKTCETYHTHNHVTGLQGNIITYLSHKNHTLRNTINRPSLVTGDGAKGGGAFR